jgi:hypothetical protein
MRQLTLFDVAQDPKPSIALAELFDAYGKCRSNKRNTLNALAFEVDHEANLLKLCAEINNGSYQPGKSIAFIVNKPVQREIFAADFRDRVVHHLIVGKLNPLFEKAFIYDSKVARMELAESGESWLRCPVLPCTSYGLQTSRRFRRSSLSTRLNQPVQLQFKK